MELQRHNRYKVKVPVVFSWQDPKESPPKGLDLTRDISRPGAFVFTATPPPLGAKARLKGCLPFVQNAVRALRLYGPWRIVRVEPARDKETRAGYEV